MSFTKSGVLIRKTNHPQVVYQLVSERTGGISLTPWETYNLATHVGDNSSHVAKNREKLQADIGNDVKIQWLEQIHGDTVVEATGDRTLTADACYTNQPNIACAVLTADCLPVLLHSDDGQEIAAVHAGWRGLTQGIIGKTVQKFAASPDKIHAFLGPCIGPDHFEVGIEVMEACFAVAHSEAQMEAIAKAFKPSMQRPLHFYANLWALAKAELNELGVLQIDGALSAENPSDWCTFSNPHYYSHRRAVRETQGKTGRFVSMIWRSDKNTIND